MMFAAFLAIAAIQATAAPAPSIAPPAVRQEITLADCAPAEPAKCAREAVVVSNGAEGICTDEVMPSGLYKVGRAFRNGYLTHARLVTDDPLQGSASSDTGSGQAISTELLIIMDSAEPSRLCVPRQVTLAGQRFRLPGDSEQQRRALAAAIRSPFRLNGVLSAPATKGFRIARARSGVEAYPLGEGANSVADFAAVRMLGEYLFGTGASALIAVKIVSDKPKPVLLDGTVRGRTNISFQVARAALDRLVVRDGTSLKSIQKCQLVAGEQQQYIC